MKKKTQQQRNGKEMQTSNETDIFHSLVNQANASVHVDKLFWWMMGCCTKLRLRTPWWWQGIISCLRTDYLARFQFALKITNDHTDGRCLLNLKISGSKIQKKKKEPWNRNNGLLWFVIQFLISLQPFVCSEALIWSCCKSDAGNKLITIASCMQFWISQGYDYEISIR